MRISTLLGPIVRSYYPTDLLFFLLEKFVKCILSNLIAYIVLVY